MRKVLLNLITIAKVLRKTKKDILEYKPDAIILVDFSGFNMKIASFCKENKIKVFYYISPKVWAWNTKRAYKIKRLVDHMFVILPFEKEFYKYNQVISVNDGLVTCKVYIDGTQVSEATSQTFNHARTQAAILALQEYNYEMLKTWLGLHREDLQAYLSVKH